MGKFRVVHGSGGHFLDGPGRDVSIANDFLRHLGVRDFSGATVRAYAFDLANFFRFLGERKLTLKQVVPSDLFEYLGWQRSSVKERAKQKVVKIHVDSPAASTMNRRIAAVRGLFEYTVQTGLRDENPVPAARRASGLRAKPRGLLGHIGGKRSRGGGRLVRQPNRLPESIDPEEVALFISDLLTHRDRAIALAMLLGGLRAAEVRSLRLADVDMGLRQLKVMGKGRRERVVPVDGVFFVELANYLRVERPAGLATEECFVVLRGPTKGRPLTEAGMRKTFRLHRERSGALRVRPHRLRHTYGTELAGSGIDLVVLRDLMGHASPETTALYVHLSPAKLAQEYEAARRRIEDESR